MTYGTKKSKKEKPMYHEILKKQFIESKRKSYKARLEALFRNSYEFETKLNKDIYEFSLEEIEELFVIKSPKNVNDVYNDIKYYLDYCKKKGLIDKNILVSVSPHDFEDLTKNERFRITEETLNKYISQCFNVQDKLILRLLFEGACGKGYSELFNLKKSDFSKETKALHLYCDTNGQRILPISDECIMLLEKSKEETVFFFDNGEANTGISGDYYCKNEYVIRSIKKKTKDETKRVDLTYLNSRFVSFKKWFNEPEISPVSVYKSGMIKHALDISKELGIHIKEFSHDVHWRRVSERFPMKDKKVNGVFQYNSIFRDIKKDEIQRLYGDYLNKTFKLLDETNVDKDIIEKKKRTTASKFKKMILEAYDGTCAITGETTVAVLEACHIQDFINEESNHYQNGILLRVDIHRLFDKGLIQINEDYTVSVSSKVVSEEYQRFNRTKIMLPKNHNWFPSKEVLRYRIEAYIKKKGNREELLS